MECPKGLRCVAEKRHCWSNALKKASRSLSRLGQVTYRPQGACGVIGNMDGIGQFSGAGH